MIGKIISHYTIVEKIGEDGTVQRKIERGSLAAGEATGIAN